MVPERQRFVGIGDQPHDFKSQPGSIQSSVHTGTATPLAASQVGDLRPYLCGFFDTTSGAKVEGSSYRNIALSLGE